MPNIIKSTIFTDRLKITTVLLDTSPEVVFKGRFFNLDKGKFETYQMVCQLDVFMDLVISLEPTHPKLFHLITDTIPKLTAEPFIICSRQLQPSGLILSGAIFVLTPIEFYSEAQGKFVYKFDDPHAFEETHVLVKISEHEPSIPTKLDLSQPTLLISDRLPLKPLFDSRQHWVRDINDNPRFLPFANQVYHLQIKYQYYLHLRSLGQPHRSAKLTAGIRELRVFNLAKTTYNLSS